MIPALWLAAIAVAGERGTCGGDGAAVDVHELDVSLAMYGRTSCDNAIGGSLEPMIDALEDVSARGGDVTSLRGTLWTELVCADHVLSPLEAARVHLANFQLIAAEQGLADTAILYAQAAIAADALLPIPMALQSRSAPIAAVFDLAVDLLRSTDEWPECLSLGARGAGAWVDGRRAGGIRREFPAIVQWKKRRNIRTIYVFPDGAIPAGGE